MSAQTERAVLAAILHDPALLTDADSLTPDAFRTPAHRSIYTAMTRLDSRGVPPEYSHVADELERMGGGLDSHVLMAELIAEPILPSLWTSYRDALLRVHRKAAAIRAAQDYIVEVQESDIDPADLWQQLGRSLPSGGDGTGPQPFSAYADQILARLDQQRDGTWVDPTLGTGFRSLDAMLGGGFRPGELIVLAARPSMGKSALAMAIARAAARVGPALFFSLEMTGISLFERALADSTGRTMDVIRGKRISTEDYQVMKRVTQMIRDSRIAIDDTAGTTTDQALVRARRYQREHGLALPVVDYLQIMGDDKQRSEGDQYKVARMSRTLKRMAMELGVPVLMLSQLNRAVESQKPPRPGLAHLRDSGAIEQDADTVMMLYRNDYYAERGMADEDGTLTGICEVLIQKQRNGPTGVVPLHFEPSTMSFRDPADAPPAWQQGAAD